MRTFNITVNGQTYVVDVEEVGGVQTAAPVRAAAPVAAAPVAAAPAAAPKAAAAAPVRTDRLSMSSGLRSAILSVSPFEPNSVLPPPPKLYIGIPSIT